MDRKVERIAKKLVAEVVSEDQNKEFSNIPGGVSDGKSLEDIAKEHGVEPEMLIKQLQMGEDVEYEHTPSSDMAKEIALDHLIEFPDYYDRLKDMEEEGKEEWD